MKIYKFNELNEKTIKWKCNNTGIYILGYFINNKPQEYSVHQTDNSYVDSFDNFFHAKNWIKKHLNKNFNVPRMGKKI